MSLESLRFSQLSRVASTFLVLVVLTALPVAAQGRAPAPSNPGAQTVAGVPSHPTQGDPEWGIAYGNSYDVPAAAFVPRDTTSVWQDSGWGRYHLQSSTSGTYEANDLMAPVNLPQGALVTVVRAFWCDSDAAQNMTTYLTAYDLNSFSGFTDIGSVTSATAGCTDSDYFSLSTTIDNYNNQYNVIVRFGGAGASLDFRGARLWYFLQISPAPATATFADVPTDYWAFRHIEALYASGITAGCGTGPAIYCPERTITRAEMAVYMAKALGLYWTD